MGLGAPGPVVRAEPRSPVLVSLFKMFVIVCIATIAVILIIFAVIDIIINVPKPLRLQGLQRPLERGLSTLQRQGGLNAEQFRRCGAVACMDDLMYVPLRAVQS